MDWIKLSQPVKTNLLFSPEMRRHPWLGCLHRFVESGKIAVEILAFRDLPAGRLCLFRPLGCPGVKREALIQHFGLPAFPPSSEGPLAQLLL